MSLECLTKNSQLSTLQEKIRVQAKRLYSMQEYISLCESRILQYNQNEALPLTKISLQQKPIIYDEKYNDLQQKYNSLYETYIQSKSKAKEKLNPHYSNSENPLPQIDEILPEEAMEYYRKAYNENMKLKREKENLIDAIRKEIITNDEQRNYIEILKQTLESTLIKSGIKNNLDIIKKALYTDSNSVDYPQVISDLTNLKERSEFLEKENSNIIIENNKIKEEIKEINEKFSQLQNEYNEVNKQNEQYAKENEILTEKNNELEKIKEDYNILYKQNEVTTSNNKVLKDENEKYKKCNYEIQTKLTDTKNLKEKYEEEIFRLEPIEKEYESAKKENMTIKQCNSALTQEKDYLIEQIDIMKQNLSIFESTRKENEELHNEITSLREKIQLLNDENSKGKNLYKSQVEAISKIKNELELIYKKDEHREQETQEEIMSFKRDNKKLYDKNKELNNEVMKYKSEVSFYSDLMFRIFKYHIKNLEVKNILLEIINLNEKGILISIEIIKIEYWLSKGQDEKLSYQLYSLKEQQSQLDQKLGLLENELKKYESYS